MEMTPQHKESRRIPALLVAITLGVVLSPLAQNWSPKPKDNFPLSYYPMFSARRASEYSTPTLVAVNAQGQRTTLPHRFAGSGGFNEVRHQVRARISNGKAKSLCRKLARRISREENWKEKELMTVQVITATHNLDDYFAGKKAAASEVLHASCPVQNEASQEVKP
jgi:hypothetical protein